MVIRQHIVFIGRVQGVGFRYTAISCANTFGLTGWVTNNYDGTVEMEVQGEMDKIESMLHVLEHDRFIQIKRMQRTSIPVKNNEKRFNVR